MRLPRRYDEFGRIRRKNRGGEDRRSREEAALARLRGMPVQPVSDTTQGSLGCACTDQHYMHVWHVPDISSLLYTIAGSGTLYSHCYR